MIDAALVAGCNAERRCGYLVAAQPDSDEVQRATQVMAAVYLEAYGSG